MTRLLQTFAVALLLILAMGCADSDPVGTLSANSETDSDRPLAASQLNEHEWIHRTYETEICGEAYFVDEKVHFIYDGGDTPGNRQHTVIQVTFIATATNLATGVVYRWPGHFKLTFAGLAVVDDAPHGTQTVVHTEILTGPGGLKKKIHSLWTMTIDANGNWRLDRSTYREECF